MTETQQYSVPDRAMTWYEICKEMERYYAITRKREATPNERAAYRRLCSIRPVYKPRPWDTDEPRPHEPKPRDGEPAWRCGHARTPENTHGPYRSHPGQCLACWQWHRRMADRKYRDTLSSDGRDKILMRQERRTWARRAARMAERRAELDAMYE